MGRGERLCGNAAMALLVVLHFSTLFFACIHWSNWWSLFIWVGVLFVLFVPAVCMNYTDATLDMLSGNNGTLDDATFRNCRDLGWIIAGIFMLLCYIVPVLAWYNDGFSYEGVIMVFVSITSSAWTYFLWLRMYVFQ